MSDDDDSSQGNKGKGRRPWYAMEREIPRQLYRVELQHRSLWYALHALADNDGVIDTAGLDPADFVARALGGAGQGNTGRSNRAFVSKGLEALLSEHLLVTTATGLEIAEYATMQRRCVPRSRSGSHRVATGESTAGDHSTPILDKSRSDEMRERDRGDNNKSGSGAHSPALFEERDEDWRDLMIVLKHSAGTDWPEMEALAMDYSVHTKIVAGVAWLQQKSRRSPVGLFKSLLATYSSADAELSDQYYAKLSDAHSEIRATLVAEYADQYLEHTGRSWTAADANDQAIRWVCRWIAHEAKRVGVNKLQLAKNLAGAIFEAEYLDQVNWSWSAVAKDPGAVLDAAGFTYGPHATDASMLQASDTLETTQEDACHQSGS